MVEVNRGDATDNFARMKGKARTQRIFSLLRKKEDNLPALDDISNLLRIEGENYAGCKTIPVDRIIGSEGRSSDFNRHFLPRREFMRHRWANVDTAFYEGKILPPIKVVELGGTYFVRDGNHRVSVAKAHRVAYIDAEITRLNTNIVFDPKMSATELKEQCAYIEEKDGAA